ncbi:Homeobox-leucine zipper family protein [Hibiscus syriacus]|uniref:Homeobox-leucine zipper family protein n=1 Tax=Hibiscus syriacus TaxID=106335 RepID=A0A6A3AQ13_HIBSY|nr:Homeobox-leucine zipper family protein [Hibiscus syriacus]
MDRHSGTGVAENFDSGLMGTMNGDGYESSDSFEVPPPDNGGPSEKMNNKFRRHSPHQIQVLESFFKDCPHPDERQKRELSMRLGIEKKKIKFWFQNRRTQMKAQLERNENEFLKQENDKLRVENDFLKQALDSPTCNNCGGPAVPLSSSHNPTPNPNALAAMDELIKMAHMGHPLWIKGLHDGPETLNLAEYERSFPSCIGIKPSGYTVEATRETACVPLRGLALVETLMDANRWADMFPCLIAGAATVDVLSSGTGGTRDNALQVMVAEFQVLSPFVPVRRVRFVRFCKHLSDGVWAVVDVSIDPSNAANPPMFANCRRLPSGCIIQDTDNKYTKVTWVEHSEYDESTVHHLLHPLHGSGFGFGAHRWISTLQRQCRRFALILSPSINGEGNAAGRKNVLKLARRMTYNFLDCICALSERKGLDVGYVCNAGEDVRVMVRKDAKYPAETHALSSSTSVWMPISQQRLFDYLVDVGMRCHRDLLSKERSTPAMINVAKGPGQGDRVTLFSSGLATNGSLILQETWSDASGALIVCALFGGTSASVVMNGGDTSQLEMFPMGFTILPGDERRSSSDGSTSSRCLLTTASEILVDGKITAETVEWNCKVLSHQVQTIKAALSIP